jgi:hypothetical protein
VNTAIRIATLALVFATTLARADAASSGGWSALALAGVVAPHAPALAPFQKQRIARIFDGNLTGAGAGPLTVTATKVLCRTSNVAIDARSCTLTFGMKTATLTGRLANELFATLVENGVTPDGAAGSIYAGLSGLTCTIRPAVIHQASGGGAQCTFGPY